jgi:hypothetical protein
VFGDANDAGCGLAVGRNGVCVFEHGSNYFAPVLVHRAALGDWTHVAVVYRDRRPRLYLGGVLVREGLRSDHRVFPGAGAPGGGGAPFRGEIGPFERRDRALEEAEVRELVKSMPRPGGRPAASAVEISSNATGGADGIFWEQGAYTLQVADGRTLKVDVTSLPAPLGLSGPWDVRFAPGAGAPARVTFERLEDWTARPEEGIRHYSGKATYRTAFDLPAEMQGRPLRLDLGAVRDLASVRLNGRDLGTLWLAPWRLDVTSAARPGRNDLEIDVVNVWNNRLVGDAALPAGERRTFLAVQAVAKGSDLLPAGLLGPVTLRAAERKELK